MPNDWPHRLHRSADASARVGLDSLDASSHVRERAPFAGEPEETSRAARRVAEYLKVFGLSDAGRVARIAADCALSVLAEGGQTLDVEEQARAAVRFAQARVTAWKQATFGDLLGDPDAQWLRAFLGAHPEVFLEDPEQARRVAASFGDVALGRLPLTARFSEQKFGRPRFPGWVRGLVGPVTTTAVATLWLGHWVQGLRGLGLLELVWLGLFAFLFASAALGFFTALRGFVALREVRRTKEESLPGPTAAGELEQLPCSVVVVPIYHEDAAGVFARVAAMRESLEVHAAGAPFEIFVLSDSQDPLIAAEEERAFRRVTASEGHAVSIYYRRRVKNERQKAGNLAEFFERFGSRYEYALVLDADSLMRGETMVELVRRIHQSPRVALLQAPIVPIGGETLLSRALQWSTSVAGPLFSQGLSRWAGPHGNYYGHNAVLRTRAFLECCSLPLLSGAPPFGGHFLSHDFVEAALLCRGGWEVRSAPELEGSYEGLPPTLGEYVTRDRRWCQGNLQHLRVVLSPGLPMMSRIHLFVGATAYLAGSLWLAFSLLGFVLLGQDSSTSGSFGQGSLGQDRSTALGVFGLALVMLLAPRFLGFVAALANARRRQEHGGVLRLAASFFAELLFAAAIAPILMLHHVRIVFSILVGRAVGWGAQKRKASGGLSASARGELGTTLLGVALVGTVVLFAQGGTLGALVWLAPVWLPLTLSIPIAALASSTRVGLLFERFGLLLVPSETIPDPLVERAEELRHLTEGDLAGRFRDLILDPVLVRAHLVRLVRGRPLLRRDGAPKEEPSDLELCQRALRAGPAGLSETERQALLGDAAAVRFLHQEAWCHWPVESWQVARERPQLPSTGESTRAS